MQKREANQRAATNIERDPASSKCQPKGVWEGRDAHFTAKATDSILEPERVLDLPGVEGGGTLGQNDAEQERPSPAASRAKTGRIRPDG